MSELNKLQSDVCETEEKPVPLKKICPQCKINPNYIEPNWRDPGMEGEVYLNEKTCEYMVAVTRNKKGLSFNGRQFEQEAPDGYLRANFLRKFVQPAIEIMLADQGKLITEQIICAFYNSPTFQGLSITEIATTYSDFSLAYNTLQNDPIDTDSEPCADLDIIPKNKEDDLWNPDRIFQPGEPVNPIRLLAIVQEQLPEVTNPYALELFGYPKEFYIEPDSNTLRVLVAIPAYLLEQVPDNPTADDIEESAMESLKKTEYEVFDLFGQVRRLELALLSYSTFQALFHKTRNGKLYWQDGEFRRDFYCKTEAGEIRDFFGDLKNFCKKNGWNIRSITQSVLLENAEQLEINFAKGTRNNVEKIIEYDDDNEEAIYVIKSVRVKKKYCPWTSLEKGLDKFAYEWGTIKRQTTLNYFAKLKEIDLALNARKSYPWLDFCVKFTYPLFGKPLQIHYGSMDPSNIEKTAGSCVANNIRNHLVDIKDTIFSEVLSFKDALAFSYNQSSCVEFGETKNEWDFLEIESVDQIGPGREAKIDRRESVMDEGAFVVDFQRVVEEIEEETKNNDSIVGQIQEYEKLITLAVAQVALGGVAADPNVDNYRDQLKDLNKDLSKSNDKLRDLEREAGDLALAAVGSAANEQQLDSLLAKIEAGGGSITDEQKEKLKALKKQRRKSIRAQKKIARKHGRQAAKQIRKERRRALAKQATESAIADFTSKSQDGMLAQLVDFKTFRMKGGLNKKDAEKEQLSDILKRLNMCNLNDLVLGAVECLYSGIPLGVALERAVKVALEAMDVDVFGFFISALPLDQQDKLKQQFEKDFGNIPLPWEEGYVGGKKENSNAYIGWLKEPPNVSAAAEGAEDVTVVSADPTETPAEYQERMRQKIQEWIDKNSYYDDGYLTDGEYEYFREGEEIYITKSPLRPETTRESKVPFTDKTSAAYKAVLDLYYVEKTAEDYQREAEIGSNESDDTERVDEEMTVVGRKSWFNLSEDQKSRFVSSWNSEVSSADNAHPGTFGEAFGGMEKMIVDAYIQYMMDLLEIDQLLKILERFPGAEILGRAVVKTSCAYQGIMDPPVQTGIKSFTLNPCGDIGIGLGFPEFDMKPNFFKGGKLTVKLEDKFVELIEASIERLLTTLLFKVLETIDGALSKLCETVQNQVSNILFNDSKGLDDALREAFCPDADPIDLTETKNNLFKSAGVNPNDTTTPAGMTPLETLFDTLNATMSKQEAMSLLVNSPNNMDTNTLNKVASLCRNFTPELADVFGSPEQVANVFAYCGNFIPPEVKSALRGQLDSSPARPLHSTVCLTNAEYEQWNSDRMKLYTANGLSQATAQKMIDDSNQRILDDFESLTEVLQKGPETMIQEAIADIINPGRTATAAPQQPGADEPACIDSPWDSSKSYIEKGDEDDLKNRSLAQSVFDGLEKTFLRDILSGRNGVLNNVLRDKNNFRLKKHERRVSIPLWQPNYVDSEEQWEFRKENANAIVEAFMKEPRGTFPLTVGGSMRDQLNDLSNITFAPSKDKKQITMNFENSPNYDHLDYKFKISYGTDYSEDPKIYVEVESERIRKPGESPLASEIEFMESSVTEKPLELVTNSTRPWERYTNFNYEAYRETYPYQSVVFQKLLNDHYKIGRIPLSSSLIDTYSSINNKMLSFAAKSVANSPDGGIPVGFSFGLENSEPLTFADLLYVNPDASPDDPMTWMYTHTPMEKVLGKSATENPRVHFLDPAIHGGSYMSPKIYIEPQVHSGWMGMVKVFAPEIGQCEPGDSGFLSIKEITDRVDKLKDDIPFDDRLSITPDCIVETPYDKIASSPAHAMIEGVVMATIKVYATELLLKTIPLFGSVQMNDKNIDQILYIMLAKEMKKGMKEQETFWNIIQGYTYYLVFLEQAVQVAQRQIKDGLLEKTAAMSDAEIVISGSQMNYKQIKINPKELIENPRKYDYSDIVDVVRGASIIGFGEESWEDEFNKVMNFDAGAVATEAGLGAAIGAIGAAPGAAIGAATGASIALSNDPGTTSIAKIAARLTLLTPFKVQMCRKINTIHQTKESAEVFLGALVLKEMKQMIKKMDMNLRPRPHIHDIQKYLLSKNGMLLGSSLRAGESVIEQPTLQGATGFDYGNVLDVAKDEGSNPFDGFELDLTLGHFMASGVIDTSNPADYFINNLPTDPEQVTAVLSSRISDGLSFFKDGVFYMEKYVKETKKNGETQIYNIKEYQDRIMNRTEEYPPDSLVSDVLGNAQILDGEVFGSTGIQFGVRLVYCPPENTVFEDLVEALPSDASELEIVETRRQIANIIKSERTYTHGPANVIVNFDMLSLPELSEYSGQTYALRLFEKAIPLVTYENNIKDVTFGELNLYDDNFGEDLKCYVDKMVESKDFQTLFDFCFPIKSYVSLFGIYSYYGFFESIGKDPDNRDEMDEGANKLQEQWKSKVLDRTKKRLRRMFNAAYRNDGEVNEERRERAKLEKSRFHKNLVPSAFLNLDRSTTWWQTARIVDIKPFDPEGNDCMNAFQKIFKGGG